MVILKDHNSRSPLLHSHMPFSYLFKITTFHFFLILITHATPVTFNFTNILDHQGEIILGTNESYFSSQGLQLTPNELGMDLMWRAGRASYIKPLHLWDNNTGEMADFTTSFSFIIDYMGSSPYADGITFFLAQNNSVITSGYALGLPIAPTTLNVTDKFVAVEFDTYWNDWDPVNSTNSSVGDHVGININSLISVRTEKWWSNITGGGQNEAWINYNATSQNLSVVFTGFQDNAMVMQHDLYYTVDLRKELPQWVIFVILAHILVV